MQPSISYRALHSLHEAVPVRSSLLNLTVTVLCPPQRGHWNEVSNLGLSIFTAGVDAFRLPIALHSVARARYHHTPTRTNQKSITSMLMLAASSKDLRASPHQAVPRVSPRHVALLQPILPHALPLAMAMASTSC